MFHQNNLLSFRHIFIIIIMLYQQYSSSLSLVVSRVSSSSSRRRGGDSFRTTTTTTRWRTSRRGRTKKVTVTVFDSSRQNSNIGASTSSKENEDAKIGVGRSLFKRIQLASDGYVRLALPGNDSPEVDKRPISDLLYGFLFAWNFGDTGYDRCTDRSELSETVFYRRVGHDFGFSVWHERAPALRMWSVVVATVFASSGDLFREVLRDDGDNESVSGGNIDRVYDVD